MSRTFHVITANRLAEGVVVFRAGSGEWNRLIAAAELLADEAAVETALTKAAADVAANRIVDPYPIEVEIAGPGRHPVPLRLRERIRCTGPSVVDLARRAEKQAA